ncbi:MAG: Fic family protein [Phormidesmis sp.]
MNITQKLTEIDKLKFWLDSFRPLPIEVVAELKRRNDVRFTYNSNAIEGNTLTQLETEMVLSSGITIGGKTLAEHLEVIGHKEAIDYIESLALNDSSPIGQWQIEEIHSIVIRADQRNRIEAGRYRRVDVRSAGTEHLYPPNYRVPDLMDQFERWLLDCVSLHPVEYAAEAHYRFVAIHPFLDGNGRTGRLLMNLILLRAGYPHVVLQAQQRPRYLDALIAANQEGDAALLKDIVGDVSGLVELVADEMIKSLREYLSVVATAGDCIEQYPDLAKVVRDYLT